MVVWFFKEVSKRAESPFSASFLPFIECFGPDKEFLSLLVPFVGIHLRFHPRVSERGKEDQGGSLGKKKVWRVTNRSTLCHLPRLKHKDFGYFVQNGPYKMNLIFFWHDLITQSYFTIHLSP